jgi:HEAT repeat protein
MLRKLLIASLACAWLAAPCAAQQATSLTDGEKQQLARLINDLKSNDGRTLDDALNALAHMGRKAAGAMDALAAMLDDDRRITYQNHAYRYLDHTFQVNVSALRALASIGEPAVPLLIKALGNKDDQVRYRAAQALFEARRPVPLEDLARAISDASPYTRICVARMLGASKDVAAIEPLTTALKDSNRDVAVEAAKAIGEIASEKGIDPLIDALGDENYAAADALARMGQPAAQAVLARFDRLAERARGPVAIAISGLDPNSTKDLLLECLRSPHWQLRGNAIIPLARLKNADAFSAIKAMLDDPNANVSWTALRCLGEMATTDIAMAAQLRPILMKSLDDPDAKVRSMALDVLYYLPDKPGEDFVPAILKALVEESPRVRENAVRTAGKFWSPQFLPAFRRIMDDPSPLIRAEAAAALGARRVEDAVPDLVRMLDDKELRCAEHAAFALGRIGRDEVVELLIARVQDKKAARERRSAVLYGLCQVRTPRVIGPLVAALGDEDLRSQDLRVRCALKDLTGQDFGYNADAWRKWYGQRQANPGL